MEGVEQSDRVYRISKQWGIDFVSYQYTEKYIYQKLDTQKLNANVRTIVSKWFNIHKYKYYVIMCRNGFPGSTLYNKKGAVSLFTWESIFHFMEVYCGLVQGAAGDSFQMIIGFHSVALLLIGSEEILKENNPSPSHSYQTQAI